MSTSKNLFLLLMTIIFSVNLFTTDQIHKEIFNPVLWAGSRGLPCHLEWILAMKEYKYDLEKKSRVFDCKEHGNTSLKAPLTLFILYHMRARVHGDRWFEGIAGTEKSGRFIECIKFLFDIYPNHHITVLDSEGNNMLHATVKELFLSNRFNASDYLKVADIILKQGSFAAQEMLSFLHALDAYGNTPLHIVVHQIAEGNAAQRAYALKILELLVKVKASPFATNSEGKTVLQTATDLHAAAIKKENKARKEFSLGAFIYGSLDGYVSDDLLKAISIMNPTPTKEMLIALDEEQEELETKKAIELSLQSAAHISPMTSIYYQN